MSSVSLPVSASTSILSAEELRRALSVRDLTDPAAGPHAMQQLLSAVLDALRSTWGCEVRLHRQSPVVSIADT
jgi:phenylalanyl-tRNA synthetase alpha chain